MYNLIGMEADSVLLYPTITFLNIYKLTALNIHSLGVAQSSMITHYVSIGNYNMLDRLVLSTVESIKIIIVINIMEI